MANNDKISISELRREQYVQRYKELKEMHQFYKSPYSWLKARFYIEISSIFVYLLLKTKINPNTITVIYGLSAVLGGVFIASGESSLVVTGVGIFFMRGVLDWSDGDYARRIKKTSTTGHILDVYGAILGSVCLGIGLGLFVESRNESILIYYSVVLYPALRALLLTNYSQSILLRKILALDCSEYKEQGGINELKVEKGRETDIESASLYVLLYNIIYKFLDDRARTTDFIGFVIIIDVYFDTNYTFALFIALVIKWSIAYIGSFYVVARGGWVEDKHNKLVKNILNKN